MIYGHKDNNLYVNLFIPSTLRWGDIQIEQQTAFPDEEETTLVISPEKGKKEFTLLFRIPEWTKPEALCLSVNGKRQNVTVKEGYVSLNRTWSKGDKVRLELPMHLRAIALPDGSANYSILYGPIVLAARLGKQNQMVCLPMTVVADTLLPDRACLYKRCLSLWGIRTIFFLI